MPHCHKSRQRLIQEYRRLCEIHKSFHETLHWWGSENTWIDEGKGQGHSVSHETQTLISWIKAVCDPLLKPRAPPLLRFSHFESYVTWCSLCDHLIKCWLICVGGSFAWCVSYLQGLDEMQKDAVWCSVNKPGLSYFVLTPWWMVWPDLSSIGDQPCWFHQSLVGRSHCVLNESFSTAFLTMHHVFFGHVLASISEIPG